MLSGGAYLGEMVSQKLCVPHGAPGVKFYHFEGVQAGKEPARVQQYLMAFDQLQLGEDVRNQMLKVMKRIYMDTEAMMTEIFDMNPASGVSYRSSKEEGERELPAPCKEQLTLSLQAGGVGYASSMFKYVQVMLRFKEFKVSDGFRLRVFLPPLVESMAVQREEPRLLCLFCFLHCQPEIRISE